MKHIDVDFSDIQECVDNSFMDYDRATSENKILRKEAEEWRNNGPSFYPAVIINDQPYRGFLSSDNVFEAICQGFKKHPSECKGVVSDYGESYNGISTEM